MDNSPFTMVALAGLVVMMFSMGLGVRVADFLNVVRRPFPVAVGLLGQVFLLPVAAYLIAILFDLPPFMAIGLMIVAACPGGATSNAFSFLARGDVALSISLTAVSGALAFITVPLIVGFSVVVFSDQSTNISLSVIDTSLSILTTTLLPVAVGMAARAKVNFPWDKVKLSLFSLGLLFILGPSVFLVVGNFDVMRNALGATAGATVLLNISMVLIGFFLAAMCRLPENQRRTIALEVGLQNFGLAIVIIMIFLQDPRMLVPGLFYLPSMLLTGCAIVAYAHWMDRRRGN